jgi:hypothetical protein
MVIKTKRVYVYVPCMYEYLNVRGMNMCIAYGPIYCIHPIRVNRIKISAHMHICITVSPPAAGYLLLPAPCYLLPVTVRTKDFSSRPTLPAIDCSFSIPALKGFIDLSAPPPPPPERLCWSAEMREKLE